VGGKWFWLLIAGGVVWYLSQREKLSTSIQANKSATGAIQHAGGAVNTLIDSGASALGKWIGGLGSSGSSSSSSSSSSSGSSAAFSSGAGTYYGDPSEYVEDFDYSS
jgi:hypothetical protein